MADHDDEVHTASTISKRKKEYLPFVEVICNRTKKTWRFAAGTEAKFAVKIINGKIASKSPLPPGTHVEAVKDGEEPVIFGPNSVLVNYGDGWSLRTASDSAGFGRAKQDDMVVMGQAYHPLAMGSDDKKTSQAASKTVYIGRILLAFIFIFLLAAIFTLILESLPQLLEYHLHSDETR